MKLNNSDSYEPIMVILSPDKYPIAFNNKVEELLEQKLFNTRAEAEAFVVSAPIEIELYYEKGTGLFAVESEAVESGTIYSPYTKELLEDPAKE